MKALIYAAVLMVLPLAATTAYAQDDHHQEQGHGGQGEHGGQGQRGGPAPHGGQGGQGGRPGGFAPGQGQFGNGRPGGQAFAPQGREGQNFGGRPGNFGPGRGPGGFGGGPGGGIHHFQGRDFRHFSPADQAMWRGGGWHHEFRNGRWGWWWLVGGMWYWYDQPVYPYPMAISSVMYADGGMVGGAYGPPQQVRYYCPNIGYYPEIPNCPVPFQQVYVP
ncbi:hypothetical protein ACYJW8_13225 [Frateuria aurantia]